LRDWGVDYILQERKVEMTIRKNAFHARLVTLFLLIASLALVHCERTVTYHPQRPDAAHFSVYHLGTYSSKVDEEKEIQGTIFQTYLANELEKVGTGWILHRKLDSMVARGFHKLSMPNEIEKKLKLDFMMDESFIPRQVLGYDSLASVFGRIDQKEEFRNQLLLSSDTGLFSAQWRDWWRMAEFLPQGQKLEAKQVLSVDAINPKLETLKLDSAKFNGPRPRMHKSCLDYTLYYHRVDSLPLLVEQLFYSASPNRKFRKYNYTAASVAGFLQYSVDRKTGLPCFQSKTEIGDMVMKLAVEKLEVPIHLYRYEEDLYD
jgi:hypothetical protein